MVSESEKLVVIDENEKFIREVIDAIVISKTNKVEIEIDTEEV